MADDRNTPRSGTGGNSSGTGGPNHGGMVQGESSDDRARRPAVGGGPDDTAGLVERDTRLEGDRRDFGGAGPRAADSAEAGRDAGSASAPGPRGGKLSSEGTGDAQAGATDPGDPGGMGGARSKAGTSDNRPPGGVSPIDGADGERGER